MKPQEAISAIKEMDYRWCHELPALNLAIKALEKQIPRKPIGWNSDCWDCARMLGGSENQPDFCPDCGQATDWSADEN